MKNHVVSMISWFKIPKPCHQKQFSMIDFLKTTTAVHLGLLLHLLTYSCRAIENFCLFPIMLLRTGEKPQGWRKGLCVVLFITTADSSCPMLCFTHEQIVELGDYINCLEVGIWEEQQQSEDGRRRLLNVINAVVIVKGVSIETFSAVLHKNAR